MMVAQEKNRAMNTRVDNYFRFPPETMVLTESHDGEIEAEAASESNSSSSNSDVSSEAQDSVRQDSISSSGGKHKLFSRVRNRSKRLSMALFK